MPVLDANYRNVNVFVLGDMNLADKGGADGEIATWGLYDDLDTDGTSDYEHAAGAKSDLAWDDIDHILLSNELYDELMAAPSSLQNQTLSSSISDHKLIKTALLLQGGTSTDTEAPTAPTNLSASGITANDFTLSWTASTDNVGVTVYEVSQDGSLLGTTSETSYYVSGLTAAKSYGYTVVAKDAAGNTSVANSPLEVATTSAAEEQPMLSSIQLRTTSSGPWVTATGNVSVTANGVALENALVEVNWSGDFNGTDAATQMEVRWRTLLQSGCEMAPPTR